MFEEKFGPIQEYSSNGQVHFMKFKTAKLAKQAVCLMNQQRDALNERIKVGFITVY